MAGYEEEFLGNGCTNSDDDVLENAYLIGKIGRASCRERVSSKV